MRAQTRPARCGVALLSCTLLTAGAGTVPAQTERTQGPRLRVTTRLVEVNVIALDRRGQPVRNLTRDDFELFDENTPQVIQAFSMETTERGPAPAKAQPLPPNTFSNRAEANTAGTLSVILFDELNTKIHDKLFARERIIRFLSQLKPEDRIAIYLLSDRLRVLHDFTSDAEALHRVIARQTGSAAGAAGGADLSSETIGDGEIDAFLESASRRMNNAAIRNGVARTLSAIELIARRLAPISGRKNLIWVSGGFPLTLGLEPRRPGETDFREQDLFTAETERAARAVNEANIAIYPIDARGLYVDPMLDDEIRADFPFFASRRGQAEGYDRNSDNNQNQARDATPGGQSPSRTTRAQQPHKRMPSANPSPALRRQDATIDSTVLLADRTGGRAFYNSNDIAGALRASLDESEVTYRLAFEPTHKQWNGQFRRIKVRVKQEGIRLRHRQGYLAQLEASPADTKAQLASLQLTAASPIQFGDVALRAQLLPRSEAGLPLRLYVERSDVLLTPTRSSWNGEVDILFELVDDAGSPLWTDGRRLAFTLLPPLYAASEHEGIPMNKTVPYHAKARQLRIAVRDVQTGALGSLRIPLSTMN